jgi:peptidoglycan/LPS O-acetylase OafA/YrhL
LSRAAENAGEIAAPAATGTRIPALTGVRALAAFLVFFHHHPTKYLQFGPLALWWEMHVGVTLFFVLSGFMITWRYDRRGLQKQSFLRGYFVNRFARIYPLYFALVVPTMLLWNAHSFRAWFFNLTVFSHFEAGIPQAWSLRVEECFYLFAPLLFLLWRRSPVLPLLAGAAALLVLWPVAMLPAMEGILGPPRRELLLYTFFGRFFEFYVGIWLAHRVARWRPSPATERRFPTWTIVGMLGIAGVIAALAAIHASRAGAPYTYGVFHPAGTALNNLVLPIFIAAFYWGLVTERSIVRWALSTRVADLLGRSSYAFYLIHMGTMLDVALAALVACAGVFGAGAAARATGWLGHGSVLFVVVTLFSIALYEGIEAPANRFLRRRFGHSGDRSVVDVRAASASPAES